MTAGTTSGPMLVTVTSDDPLNDVMAGWQFVLTIAPETASGTLVFQDPSTGIAPAPSNYIFGASGLGITVTNMGSNLAANDFFDPSVGPGVPGAGPPGATFFEMTFQASTDASGLFGVYAVRGAANTVWTDSGFSTQFFSNVPDGTGMVLIGEVQVTGAAQPVPEPASMSLVGAGVLTLAGWRCWRKRKQVVD
jgi:hypothetical protein